MRRRERDKHIIIIIIWYISTNRNLLNIVYKKKTKRRTVWSPTVTSAHRDSAVVRSWIESPEASCGLKTICEYNCGRFWQKEENGCWPHEKKPFSRISFWVVFTFVSALSPRRQIWSNSITTIHRDDAKIAVNVYVPKNYPRYLKTLISCNFSPVSGAIKQILPSCCFSSSLFLQRLKTTIIFCWCKILVTHCLHVRHSLLTDILNYNVQC